MGKTLISDGTKIAQAAKELNVTSVTIRRYLSEFNIETTSDENGIKVLPATAMEELKLIRQLKDDGLTNPKVMEHLEELRVKQGSSSGKETKVKASRKNQEADSSKQVETVEAKDENKTEALEEESPKEEKEEQTEEEAQAPGKERSKHTLTCQTCGKVFEHMNPRLRDCLDCYRIKRKERRRGGDKHKTIIQHPLVKQVINKNSQAQQEPGAVQLVLQPASSPVIQASRPNYRKAIEETRHITANLKRRLERPDLQESERRWLEQVYAYQLILHQGWRHLAEYKSGGHEQNKSET